MTNNDKWYEIASAARGKKNGAIWQRYARTHDLETDIRWLLEALSEASFHPSCYECDGGEEDWQNWLSKPVRLTPARE